MPDSPSAWFEIADEAGVDLRPRDLWMLGSRSRTGGEAGSPPVVADFIVQLLQGTNGKAILDPWVGYGSLLAPVAAALGSERVVGRHPNASTVAAASRFLPGADFQVGYFDERDEELGSFDVVVSNPPLNFQGGRAIRVGDVEVADDRGHQILVRAALLLADDGVGVFVVTPRFLWKKGRTAIRALPALGLHLDAFFEVPAGSFQPYTSIATGIAVVRRGTQEGELFVGQISDDDGHNRTLISNYRKRTPGKRPELGALVARDDFRGLQQLQAARELEKLGRRLGVAPVRLGDIATITRLKKDEPVEEDPAAFYLPLNLVSPVRENVADLPKTLNSIVRVRVDPDLADARVVAGFFRSPLGHLVRERVSAGATIAAMPISEVADLPVWLPDLDAQRRVAETDLRIRTLTSELEELRERLWGRLTKADEVISMVASVNREDTFTDWVDTLPFPLSSVLWTYHTLKGQPLKRYFQLEYFFEALAQYLAIQLMSAVRRDLGRFEVEWEGIKATLARGHMSLERSTFGTWMAIYESLSKTIRTDLSDADKRAAWVRLFAIDDDALLEGLVNKKMVALLKKANSYRNTWRGHGGVVGDEEAARRQVHFEELLVEFRNLVGRRWETYPLVLPVSFKFSAGVYRSTGRVAMGVRVPFETAEYELKHPLEDGILHAVSPRTGEVCPLVPFVRLGPSPATEHNACYFFNRLEGSDPRWVSFHFEQKPEVVEPDPGMLTLLRSLEPAR